MNDTQRLDFILSDEVEIYKSINGKWYCMIDDLVVGSGETARDAIEDAAANSKRVPTCMKV